MVHISICVVFIDICFSRALTKMNLTQYNAQMQETKLHIIAYNYIYSQSNYKKIN